MIKMSKLFAAGICAAAALSVSVTAAFAEGDIVIIGTDGQQVEEVTAPNGIYVGNISVGGMTASEIEDVIDNYIETVKGMQLTVESSKGSTQLDLSAMSLVCNNKEELAQKAVGGQNLGNLIAQYKQTKDLECNSLHLEMSISVDASSLASYLLSQIPQLESSPVEPTAVMNSDGTFSFTEGQDGFAIDYDGTYDAVCEALANYDGTSSTITAEVVGTITESTYDMSVFDGFGSVLGQWSTEFNTDSAYENRATNVKLATQRIDGTVLMPGETFSFCEAMQPFTAEAGFKEAGTYMDGQTVDNLGGGVCQVSSTLYNAVLWAELTIPDGGRKPHSKTVTYVEPAMDAMVYVATGSDFQFTNSTEHAIYIQAYITADRAGNTAGETVADVVFVIYGTEYRASNRTIEYESVVISEENPDPVYIIKYDDSLDMYEEDPGRATTYSYITASPHKAMKAKLIKHVYIDGVEQGEAEYIHTDSYTASSGELYINSKTVIIEASTEYNDDLGLISFPLSNIYIEEAKKTTAATTTKKETTTEQTEEETEKTTKATETTTKEETTASQTETKPSTAQTTKTPEETKTEATTAEEDTSQAEPTAEEAESGG